MTHCVLHERLHDARVHEHYFPQSSSLLFMLKCLTELTAALQAATQGDRPFSMLTMDAWINANIVIAQCGERRLLW